MGDGSAGGYVTFTADDGFIRHFEYFDARFGNVGDRINWVGW
jgi:hypothetical protein